MLDECKVILPNILLLEFGSGIDGFSIGLPDSLDLSKFAENKEESYVYEYVGCVGRLKKKYITHVKTKRDNVCKGYRFDQVLIKEC